MPLPYHCLNCALRLKSVKAARRIHACWVGGVSGLATSDMVWLPVEGQLQLGTHLLWGNRTGAFCLPRYVHIISETQ